MEEGREHGYWGQHACSASVVHQEPRWDPYPRAAA